MESPRKYIPTPQEEKVAESLMTDEQKIQSLHREVDAWKETVKINNQHTAEAEPMMTDEQKAQSNRRELDFNNFESSIGYDRMEYSARDFLVKLKLVEEALANGINRTTTSRAKEEYEYAQERITGFLKKGEVILERIKANTPK